MRASSFYESVRQEAITLWTPEQLGFASKDITIIIDFEKVILNEFFVNGTFSLSIVVEGYSPLFEQSCNFFMVFVGKLFGGNP